MTIFALRVDIDTLKGLREGVPNLLSILAKYDIKASFFCPMGWEGDIISVLKYRIFRTAFSNSHKIKSALIPKKSTVIGKKEMFRCLFFPKQFTKESNILNRIIDEGHDLGVHGYIHTRWHNLNYKEMDNEFREMVRQYKKSFGENPAGFASPLFVNNRMVHELLNKYKFLYSSLEFGSNPYIRDKRGKTLEIPVTIDEKVNNKILPIVFYRTLMGVSSKEIIEIVAQRIRNTNYAIMHIHPEDEGIYLKKPFSGVMKKVSGMDVEVKTMKEIALTERCNYGQYV